MYFAAIATHVSFHLWKDILHLHNRLFAVTTLCKRLNAGNKKKKSQSPEYVTTLLFVTKVLCIYFVAEVGF